GDARVTQGLGVALGLQVPSSPARLTHLEPRPNASSLRERAPAHGNAAAVRPDVAGAIGRAAAKLRSRAIGLVNEPALCRAAQELAAVADQPAQRALLIARILRILFDAELGGLTGLQRLVPREIGLALLELLLLAAVRQAPLRERHSGGRRAASVDRVAERPRHAEAQHLKARSVGVALLQDRRVRRVAARFPKGAGRFPTIPRPRAGRLVLLRAAERRGCARFHERPRLLLRALLELRFVAAECARRARSAGAGLRVAGALGQARLFGERHPPRESVRAALGQIVGAPIAPGLAAPDGTHVLRCAAARRRARRHVAERGARTDVDDVPAVASLSAAPEVR